MPVTFAFDLLKGNTPAECPDLRSMATKRCRSGLLRRALAAAKAVPNWNTAHTVPSCRIRVRRRSLLRPALARKTLMGASR